MKAPYRKSSGLSNRIDAYEKGREERLSVSSTLGPFKVRIVVDRVMKRDAVRNTHNYACFDVYTLQSNRTRCHEQILAFHWYITLK